MRHVVLGAGGIGGLIAAVVARSGAEVGLLLRPESLGSYGGRLRVESVALGRFEVEVPASSSLDGRTDVLWVATKANQLDAAIDLAGSDVSGEAIVVPLLNGVDHVERLRRRFGHVVAAAIRVESERVRPGFIRQKSPFLRVDMVGAEPVQDALRNAGVECYSRDDEATMLWEKLVFLAPIALATAAFDALLGDVRESEAFIGCRAEAAAAARAAGALVELEAICGLHASAPPDMQSSMQKDVLAGREPELDAIAGPILGLGRAHGFATSATQSLFDQISQRDNQAS